MREEDSFVGFDNLGNKQNCETYCYIKDFPEMTLFHHIGQIRVAYVVAYRGHSV